MGFLWVPPAACQSPKTSKVGFDELVVKLPVDVSVDGCLSLYVSSGDLSRNPAFPPMMLGIGSSPLVTPDRTSGRKWMDIGKMK